MAAHPLPYQGLAQVTVSKVKACSLIQSRLPTFSTYVSTQLVSAMTVA